MKPRDLLPKEVAEAGFKLSKNSPAAFFDRELGDIDLGSVSVEKAQQLVDAGCEHIQKTSRRPTPES